MVKFICEGCGSEVVMYRASIPDNHYCLNCGFVEFAIADNIVKQHMHVHLGSMPCLRKNIDCSAT